jgi:hypothetical protein
MSSDDCSIVRAEICANDFSNYLVGGNLCNAFVVGEVGAPDDFFLVGAPAMAVDTYPILTGNFLDSEGLPLFRIVRNILVLNPRNCSKIMGDHVGYEIHDGQGNAVLTVQSKYHTDRGKGQYITTIHGTFYGKAGKQVATADSGQLTFSPEVKLAMGFTGTGFGLGINYTESEIEIARWSIASAGAIHQIIRGELDSPTLELDGKVLQDVTVKGGTVLIRTGDFVLAGKTRFLGTKFMFDGPAGQIHELSKRLTGQAKSTPTGAVCSQTALYRSLGCEHPTERMISQGETFAPCPQCGISVVWAFAGPA